MDRTLSDRDERALQRRREQTAPGLSLPRLVRALRRGRNPVRTRSRTRGPGDPGPQSP